MSPPADTEAAAPGEAVAHRTACTECQRRKQKCNREWPCNHCQKRKIGDRCRFHQSVTDPSSRPSKPAQSRKRRISREDPLPSGDDDEEDDDDDDDDDPGSDIDDFAALGYGTSHIAASLDANYKKKTKPAAVQYLRVASSCPQLDRAISIIPAKPYSDLLVENFFNRVNVHNYVVHPPSFRESYDSWWTDKTEGNPLGLQWTCLLLISFACSAHHADPELERKLETGLGKPTKTLTKELHNVARELQSVIPVGNHHIMTVQMAVFLCYWFKTEALPTEAWHALSVAIREAQELGIHQESAADQLSEFDREMRRRVWCNLDSLDWMMPVYLSRPSIIDRSEVDVGLPGLVLDGYPTAPLIYKIKISELARQTHRRFGQVKDVESLADVQEYQAMMEAWIRTFPPEYDFRNPDTTQDASQPWVKSHRYILCAASYQQLLQPMRPYIARSLGKDSPESQRKLRNDGVDYSLKYMNALFSYFDCVWPKEMKFHYVLFCVFDNAAVLCSALLHDVDRSIPNQAGVLKIINDAVGMLDRLKDATQIGKTSHKILTRLRNRLHKALSAGPPYRQPKPFYDSQSPSSSLDERMSGASTGFVGSGGPSPGVPGSVVVPEPQSMETDNMSASSGSAFYHTPPDNLIGADQSSMFAATSAPPLEMVDTTTMPMPDMMYASSAAIMPATSMGDATGGIYGMPPTTYAEMPPGSLADFHSQHQALRWADIPDQEMAMFAAMWNYRPLDLGFSPPPAPVPLHGQQNEEEHRGYY